MIAAWLLGLCEWSGEHDITAPADVGGGPRTVPIGPPMAITIAPGEPIAPRIASATPGSTVRLAAGRHRGPIWIDRALTLEGEVGTVVDGGGTGSVIVVTAPDVAIRHLRVTGGGFLPQQDDSGVVFAADRFVAEDLNVDHAYLGIDVRRAADGVIRGCTVVGDPDAAFGMRGDGIRLWEAQRVEVIDNHLDHVRDLVVWYGTDVLLQGNHVTGSRYGTHLMHDDNVRIVDNEFADDVVGIFVMYSNSVEVRHNQVVGASGEAGIGIGLKESDLLEVLDNTFVDNTTGVYIDTTPQRVGGSARFEGNLLGANDVGLRLHGRSPGARFVGNRFVANGLVVTVDSRVGDEGLTFDGNLFDDYAGYDLDGDGFGDVSFEARSAAGALIERKPTLAWFTGSPAAALLEVFAAAFPMFAPRAILVDPHPAMELP